MQKVRSQGHDGRASVRALGEEGVFLGQLGNGDRLPVHGFLIINDPYAGAFAGIVNGGQRHLIQGVCVRRSQMHDRAGAQSGADALILKRETGLIASRCRVGRLG